MVFVRTQSKDKKKKTNITGTKTMASQDLGSRAISRIVTIIKQVQSYT